MPARVSVKEFERTRLDGDLNSNEFSYKMGAA